MGALDQQDLLTSNWAQHMLDQLFDAPDYLITLQLQAEDIVAKVVRLQSSRDQEQINTLAGGTEMARATEVQQGNSKKPHVIDP